MFADEKAICQVTLGKTREGDLKRLLSAFQKGQVHAVRRPSGGTLRYYTNASRKAVMEVGCSDGVVDFVRLKLGFWGPLKELAKIPPGSLSDCSLECLGTDGGVHLARAGFHCDRDRILAVYGPPHGEEGSTLRYRWPDGKLPRGLAFTLDNGKVREIVLERLSEPGSLLRRLEPGLPARVDPLAVPEAEAIRDGEVHLSAGRYAQAEAEFRRVFGLLEEDDWNPSFPKAYVRSRQALAAAHLGQDESLVDARGCRNYLREWDTVQGPYYRHVAFTAARVARLLGNRGAGKDFRTLWDHLQEAPDYQTGPVQQMVRAVAVELEGLGDSLYADAVRANDVS